MVRGNRSGLYSHLQRKVHENITSGSAKEMENFNVALSDKSSLFFVVVRGVDFFYYTLFLHV